MFKTLFECCDCYLLKCRDILAIVSFVLIFSLTNKLSAADIQATSPAIVASGDMQQHGKSAPDVCGGATIHVTDETFEAAVLGSSLPTLVEFWAEWSGPNKAMAPALERLACDLIDKIVFAKHNVDDNPIAPHNYGVRGIPTLVLFKNGEVVSIRVGELTHSDIKAWLELYLLE